MMKNVSIRLREDFMKEAEKLAKLELVDKSVIIREALEEGFIDVKLKIAIEMFAKGKASTGEAAEIADLSIGEMMDELVKRGIRPDIAKEDLKGSLEKALKNVN